MRSQHLILVPLLVTSNGVTSASIILRVDLNAVPSPGIAAVGFNAALVMRRRRG
jgi:hypothetical protein